MEVETVTTTPPQNTGNVTNTSELSKEDNKMHGEKLDKYVHVVPESSNQEAKKIATEYLKEALEQKNAAMVLAIAAILRT